MLPRSQHGATPRPHRAPGTAGAGGGSGPTAPSLGTGHLRGGVGGNAEGLAAPFPRPGSRGDKDTERSLTRLPAPAVPSPLGRAGVGGCWCRVISSLGLALGSLGSSPCAFVIVGWLVNIGCANGFLVRGRSSHRVCHFVMVGSPGDRGARGQPAGRALAWGCPPCYCRVSRGGPGPRRVGRAGGAPGTGGSRTGIYTLGLEKGEDGCGASVGRSRL